MKVKVKLTNDKARVPFKTYKRDFCYDVVATSVEELHPNVYKYGIGLAFEPVVDLETMGDFIIDIDLRPRSSVWKTGMVLSSSTGTIDEIFRGEASAVFYHVITDLPIYEVGDKIGQIKIGITMSMEFEVVDELSKTERGKNAYGSTGRKG